MKTQIAAVSIAASLALLSCSNTGNEQGQSASNLFESTGSFSDILDSSFVPKNVYALAEMPTMDSRVVAYKKGLGYTESSLSLGYNGITDDSDILESWFPNTLSSGQANDECDYFAIYSSTYSAPFTHYLTLSQDNALHAITCTIKGNGFYATTDLVHEAILVCGDKAGTLRGSINADSVRIYRDPSWDCGGAGGPNPDDIFFEKQEPINLPPVSSPPATSCTPSTIDEELGLATDDCIEQEPVNPPPVTYPPVTGCTPSTIDEKLGISTDDCL